MNEQIDRDAHYRVAALQCAVARAGQDGGLEGKIDVLHIAQVYYGWLTGNDDMKDPIYEKAQE